MNIGNIANVVTIFSGLWVVAFGIGEIVWIIKRRGNIKINPLVLANILGAAVVLILSIVIPHLFSQVSKPPTDFKVTNIHNGKVIQQQDLPLTIKGTDSSEGSSGTVWVVLIDSRGQYYLQNPPVRFQSNSTWTASNVQPLVGIVEIDFVFVDNAGNSSFETMVSTGAFSQLPDNSNILLRVSITSQATNSV